MACRLAFVRAGGIEIGHLAAPPRTGETVEATLRNLAAAARIVGAAPQIENIATLIDPPGSVLGEPAWLRAIAPGSGCDLLLDLHNVHANTLNFGHDPLEFLHALPLEKVAMIHLAGGKWIGPAGRERLLDDHLHDVPDPVFALLTEAAARARFLADPRTAAADAGLTPEETAAAEKIDRLGLQMAATSLRHKRAGKRSDRV